MPTQPSSAPTQHMRPVDNVSEPSAFGVSLDELKSLMETRGPEALEKLRSFGGIAGLCERLRTTQEGGLDGEPNDLRSRVALFGANILPPKPPKTFLQLMFEAASDTTLIILMAAAGVSFLLSFYNPGSGDVKLGVHCVLDIYSITMLSTLRLAMVTSVLSSRKLVSFFLFDSRFSFQLDFSLMSLNFIRNEMKCRISDSNLHTRGRNLVISLFLRILFYESTCSYSVLAFSRITSFTQKYSSVSHYIIPSAYSKLEQFYRLRHSVRVQYIYCFDLLCQCFLSKASSISIESSHSSSLKAKAIRNQLIFSVHNLILEYFNNIKAFSRQRFYKISRRNVDNKKIIVHFQ